MHSTCKRRCQKSSNSGHTEKDETRPFFSKEQDTVFRQNGANTFFQGGANRGLGHHLPSGTLAVMNESFGADFGQVNIHTGDQAIQMNQSLHSQAFTYGNDVYFNKGKYKPETPGGKHLLAHELTHVIQQQGTTHAVQRSPEANQVREKGAENDPESFSIVLARHYLANQRNGIVDPTQKANCIKVRFPTYECLLEMESGLNIKTMWNTETNRAIAKATINGVGSACGYSYSVGETDIVFTLIKCWGI